MILLGKNLITIIPRRILFRDSRSISLEGVKYITWIASSEDLLAMTGVENTGSRSTTCLRAYLIGMHAQADEMTYKYGKMLDSSLRRNDRQNTGAKILKTGNPFLQNQELPCF